tara:strand:- start:1015 stop:2325 length:1311 start_codon:yes stop_codon:yes gene_type:complete
MINSGRIETMALGKLERSLGILCHLTSLPEPDLGENGAIRFLRHLQEIGVSVWQMLPIHPPDPHGSPYASSSAFAGWESFLPQDEREITESEVAKFCEEQGGWVEEYALFRVLKERFDEAPWTKWPEGCRTGNDCHLNDREKLRFKEICEQQVRFNHAWMRFRKMATSMGISLYGDIPFFVSHDSADVWSAPHRFHLDENGEPTHVSGVPPDYFSDTGQRWGTPLYLWESHSDENYDWWVRRMRRMFDLFDIVRIDHFRAFESAWSIPAHHPTAEYGQWENGPGDNLLKILKDAYPHGIIAEDLGIIPKTVENLRKRYEIPGMAVLQFSNEDTDNPHHPENHRENMVVYTGTHDNDTTVGWGKRPVELMIRTAMKSPAFLCIIPLQDVLQLGSEARMNTPGTTERNWKWNFEWNDLNCHSVEWFTEIASKTRPRTS